MRDPRFERTTLILSRHWKSPESELSFVARSVAGAASRTSQVCVVIPVPAGRPEPDGAFDLLGAGAGDDGSWPVPPLTRRGRSGLPQGTTIVVDEPDDDALGAPRPFRARATGACDRRGGCGRLIGTPIPPLRFTASPEGGRSEPIRLHVPINPLAATHRHNGLGFTGYLLVLSDRTGPPGVSPPTPMVAWLTARFPDMHVVVVEDAVAAVWRGRALRGVVSVYTRTDLWRLVAHALVTIDLAPGPIVARECVESLRFGTPILVPVGSAAQPHADAGAGMSFSDYSELLACVTKLSDDGRPRQPVRAGPPLRRRRLRRPRGVRAHRGAGARPPGRQLPPERVGGRSHLKPAYSRRSGARARNDLVASRAAYRCSLSANA